jgi:glycosyltransferase involved in cell wall biosynthesis
VLACAALNVCTIIAKNYVAHARVLARSLKATDPQARLWTLIIDDFERYIDPEREPFDILTPADVGCEPFLQMAVRYSVLELSTAVKPWLLRHLMAQTGGPVTYLDPDIKVFGSLARLDALAHEHGLVLTPHNNEPIPSDGRRPGQIDIMIAGVYNLGYVTLAPRPEIERLLDWWADRLVRDCRVDPVWGYFVDQRWFDLAPGLVSDLAILRDSEFNVAYWNLHSRALTRDGGRYMVGDRPLAFFHFSGFDPAHPLVLSRHQDRTDVAAHPALEQILAEYAAEVLAEGHAVSREWPYTYGALGDGVQLDATVRGLYDAFLDDRERRGEEAPSPFSIEGAQAFDVWIKGQAPGALPGVSRTLAHIYAQRTDLKAAYPDLAGAGGAGLMSWGERYGRNEYSLLARVLAEPHGAGPATPAGGDEATESAVGEPLEALRNGPWGVNLVGQFGGGSEPGPTAEALLEALDTTDVPAAPIQSHGPGVRSLSPVASTLALDDAPFSVNLLAITGDDLRDFAREAGRRFFGGRYSIGLWFPALERLPETWPGALSLLEEVWAPSRHAAASIEAVATVPVRTVPIAVTAPPFDLSSRAQLGLDGERFTFLCRVDYASDAARVDTGAAIAAFGSVVSPQDGADLVVHCLHAEDDPEEHGRLLAAAGEAGAIVIDRALSPAQGRSLIAACDCFVSLHRAVAFGRPIAEAMWHAKPVIATAYSGNLDYMNAYNGYLVGHKLVNAGLAPYPRDVRWAAPDVGDAATAMRDVLDDRAAAAQLGARAAQDIRRTHSPAAAGRMMARLLELVRATGRARTPADEASEIPPAVAAMPMLLQRAGSRGAAPGPGRRTRELARRGVLTVMRPLASDQQTINEALVKAMMELNREIVALRRDDAGKRAGLLAQLRRYERLIPLAGTASPDPDGVDQGGTPEG